MKRLALSGIGIALFSFFLYRKWAEVVSVASVLLYMTMFSLVLAPVCSKLEKLGMRPSYAACSAVAGFFLVVLVLVAVFIPYLITQSGYLIKRISPAAAGLAELMMQWRDRLGIMEVSVADSGSMISAALTSVTGKLVRSGMGAAKQIGRIAFSLVLTYYVLCDRRRIVNHLLLIVPLRMRRSMLDALFACGNAMMGYVSGLLKTSAFVTAATLAGLLVLGVQDAVLLALMMGILEVLPYLGPVLAAVPILLSAMMQGTQTALFTLIMLIVVQQIEGNFVSPYFTASSTSVHPLSAILAVFVLGSLMGIWGILLAVPLLVLFQSAVCSLQQTRQMHKVWV